MTKNSINNKEELMIKNAIAHAKDWVSGAWYQGGALATPDSVATIEDLKMAKILNRSTQYVKTIKLTNLIKKLEEMAGFQQMYVNADDLKKQIKIMESLV